MKTIKKIATLAMASCLSFQVAAQTTNPQAIEVSLIKGPEPIKYQMTNDMNLAFAIVGLWIPLLANKARNSSMSSELTTEIYRLNPRFSDLLHDELQKNLTSLGINVTPGPDVSVDPTKKWDANFKAMNPDNKNVIYMFFDNIGVRAHHQHTTYQPVAYAHACLLTPKDKKYCTEEFSVAFGDNHEVEDDYVVLAEPGERWRDDADVHMRVRDVEKALRRGITKMAVGLSKQIAESLKRLSNNPEQTVKQTS